MNLERCVKGHFYNLDDMSTCPYCENKKIIEKKENEVEIKTMAYIKLNIEPVVAWLVCIEGVEKGKDYRIINKRNFIGNSEEMDVCILGDNSIEKNSNFTITYNEKQRIFVLTPGSISNIIYVNKKAVYESIILENYSLVEFGETKLVFVKFCGDNFSWKI